MSKRIFSAVMFILLSTSLVIWAFKIQPTKAGNTFSSANELSFTFNSPDYPWNESELVTLQTWVTDFYPVAKKIYGIPAFNITIDIRKDPDSPFAGYYAGDKLVLKSLQDDVLVHEMIHAFHGNYIIGFGSFEEGMTRAAEVEVFNQLEAYTYWDENHSYSIDVYYEHDNQPDIAAKYGSFWSGFINPTERYQLAGYAWAKAFLEDKDFFVNFNQEYYGQAFNNDSIRSDESRLKDIARKVKPTVEGYDFDTWYSKQNILNINPTSGYKLTMKADNSGAYMFYRYDDGREEMQTNATISWSVYDCLNNLLDSGTEITNEYGVTYILPTRIPPDYLGRIRIEVTAESPEGRIVRSYLRESQFWNRPTDRAGIFGIVENQNDGSITITPLDDPTPPATVMVVNGSFSAPSFEKARGRFSMVCVDSFGQQFNRMLTKDASSYFAIVALALHDVAVVKVAPQKATIGENSPVSINITVENQGLSNETFNVTVSANATVIGTQLLALEAGTSTTITLTWASSGFAKGKYNLVAYAEPVPGESDIADNNFTGSVLILTIPGDINGDFTVNVLDAITLSNSFLAVPGSSNWNPNADINSDNVVNILDAIILSNNFLQHYP